MQGTADFHAQIADACLPQPASVVDEAAALDAAVDVRAVFGAHVRGRPRGFLVGMMIAT